MEREYILSKVDHTLLRQDATWEEIRAICDDGIKYHTASVCIPPCFVGKASKYVEGRIPICTVIGFPNGYNSREVKCFEAENAVKLGADEIDMVINIGDVKMQNYTAIESEINAVKSACGTKLLKVIVETCLLTRDEKIKMCHIVSSSNADYIKTSTGFSHGGATSEDIYLFAENVDRKTKIKAAGGIRTFEDAEMFLSLGASRLGTSRLVELIKKEGKNDAKNSDSSY